MGIFHDGELISETIIGGVFLAGELIAEEVKPSNDLALVSNTVAGIGNSYIPNIGNIAGHNVAIRVVVKWYNDTMGDYTELFGHGSQKVIKRSSDNILGIVNFLGSLYYSETPNPGDWCQIEYISMEVSPTDSKRYLLLNGNIIVELTVPTINAFSGNFGVFTNSAANNRVAAGEIRSFQVFASDPITNNPFHSLIFDGAPYDDGGTVKMRNKLNGAVFAPSGAAFPRVYLPDSDGFGGCFLDNQIVIEVPNRGRLSEVSYRNFYPDADYTGKFSLENHGAEFNVQSAEALGLNRPGFISNGFKIGNPISGNYIANNSIIILDGSDLVLYPNWIPD
ncbi:MAG: hypothetical protein FWF85_02405 [Clostridiales bacterium]|jgi:hypothetical protein|nr:hypothetical protein [Clostridiales bacterium]